MNHNCDFSNIRRGVIFSCSRPPNKLGKSISFSCHAFYFFPFQMLKLTICLPISPSCFYTEFYQFISARPHIASWRESSVHISYYRYKWFSRHGLVAWSAGGFKTLDVVHSMIEKNFNCFALLVSLK